MKAKGSEIAFTAATAVLASLAPVLPSGCAGECAENRAALPLAGFYVGGDPAQKATVDSLSVRGIGAPGDSVLFDGTADNVYLPFRIDRDTTRYIFTSTRRRPLGRPDTVTFIYERILRLSSPECGASYYYRIEKTDNPGTIIDSVVCPQGYIDNANVENLRIYFNPLMFPAASGGPSEAPVQNSDR